MKVLTTIDLLALPSLETPPAGHVGFGAKSDGLYQKVGTVETKLAIDGHTHSTSDITSGIFNIARIPTGTSGTTVALGNHLHTGVYEPVFTKNTAFNKNFGTAAGTVSEGNHTHTFASLTSKPTTLAGYGITDAALASHTHPYLPLSGGTMSNTNLVTNLNADLLDGLHRTNLYSGVSNFINVIGNNTSITIEGDANTYYPVTIGGIFDKSVPCRISVWKNLGSKTNSSYSGNHRNGTSSLWLQYEWRTIYWDGNGGYCKTLYKSQPYATLVSKVEIPSSSQNYFVIYLRGGGTQYNITTTNANSGVNVYYTETNLGDSTHPFIVTPTTSIGNGGIYTTTYLGYGDISGNASSATKLQTARTIAGVSFDGTANIAIPFANLSSKPTTLGGYGITDAVTLNTAQTISGKKTFSDTVTAPTFSGALSGNASSATKLQTARTINGVAFDGSANITITAATPATLTRGSYLTGSNFNGSVATTWAVDATSANTASKVVARDASGNFSAGTITAALNGNASTATKLQTSRTLWGRPFDGSGNVDGALTGVTTLTASTSVTVPKVIFAAAGWSVEQSGTEIQFKYNGTIKQRLLSDGSIVAVGEVTAYGATS